MESVTAESKAVSKAVLRAVVTDELKVDVMAACWVEKRAA